MSTVPGPALREGIRARGALPFVDFVRHVLYHPEEGYYCRDRDRVGADRATDFVTNVAVRSVFAPAVVEAVTRMLRDGRPEEYAFCEVGAEPGVSLLKGMAHPFREVRVYGRGDSFVPVAGEKVILFANECLDAQPFVRLVFRQGSWREVFVELTEDGNGLRSREATPISEDALVLCAQLPCPAPEGYRVDFSRAAESVLWDWVRPAWTGVFLTFDYGSSWEALTTSLPGGTARAYHRHTQSTDLLNSPGEQDLTCNVCWDRLGSVLRENGFCVREIQRQEAFLMTYAQDTLRQCIEDTSPEASHKKAKVMQLLNPAHFGAAFQVLTGSR